MKNMLLAMVKDEVEEKIQEANKETKLLDIRNLMTNLKLTLEQAMDALSIPQAERATYAGLIQKNNS